MLITLVGDQQVGDQRDWRDRHPQAGDGHDSKMTHKSFENDFNENNKSDENAFMLAILPSCWPSVVSRRSAFMQTVSLRPNKIAVTFFFELMA